MPLDAEASNRIFNAIAPRYDALNALLSFGRHRAWRARLAAALPQTSRRLLDIATGTADIPLTLLPLRPRLEEIVGVDISEGMLAVGRIKVARAGAEGRVALQQADAGCLPFADGYFDAVTAGFMLRNVPHIVNIFAEVRRVISPGGVFLALEFSRPSLPPASWLHRAYLAQALPAIGGLLTGEREAYRHLGASILSFPPRDRVRRMLLQAGFADAGSETMTCGAVTLYRART